MKYYANKKYGIRNNSLANAVVQNKNERKSELRFIDNRPEADVQRKLQKIIKNKGVSSLKVAQRKEIEGTHVVLEGGYTCFKMEGKKYHLNLAVPKHVTCDSEARMHYYFKGMEEGITDVIGPGKKDKKRKFSQLPPSVQNFIRGNYMALIRVH